jgi:hypothetical protein
MTYPLPATFSGSATVTNTNINNWSALINALALTLAGVPMMPTARVATTGAETFTITAGTVTTINGTTIDGVTVSATGAANGLGDYILIKDAPAASGVGSTYSTQPANGLYQVTAVATNITLARATQMSAAATAGAGPNSPDGMLCGVMAGTVNIGNAWWVSAPNNPSAAFTYGSTAIAFTQALVTPLSGQVLANKRIAKRVGTMTSSATPAINTDLYDTFKITLQAVPITSWTVTGTPQDRDELTLCITDNGTTQNVSWTGFTHISSGVASVPNTTSPGNKMTLKFVYDADYTAWALIAADVGGYNASGP